jgi:amino acid transporter
VAGIFSCFLAIHNTTVRVMFSMGRDRVLPASSARCTTVGSHRTARSLRKPSSPLSVNRREWARARRYGSYGFTGAIGTVAIVIVYVISNIALIRYFWQKPRAASRPTSSFRFSSCGPRVPAVSVAAPGQAYPTTWSDRRPHLDPLGLGLYLYFRATAPEKIAAIGTFVAEDDLPIAEQHEFSLTARAPSVQHPTVAEVEAMREVTTKGGE